MPDEINVPGSEASTQQEQPVDTRIALTPELYRELILAAAG